MPLNIQEDLNDLEIAFVLPIGDGFQVLPPFPFPALREVLRKGLAEQFPGDGGIAELAGGLDERVGQCAFINALRTEHDTPYEEINYTLRMRLEKLADDHGLTVPVIP